jgi:arylsulfatase
MSLHEGGLRVPLIACWPGMIAAGTSSDHVTGLQDLAATFLDLAGAAALPDQDGISLAPTLLGRGRQPRHPWLYFEFRSAPGGPQQALRMGPWKALRRITEDGPAATQLYDLTRDPGESVDVAGTQPAIVARVHAAWAEAHTPSAEFPLRPR